MPIQNGGRKRFARNFLATSQGPTTNGSQFFLALLTSTSSGIGTEASWKGTKGYPARRASITLQAADSDTKLRNSTSPSYTVLTSDWDADIVGYAITTSATAALTADNVIYTGTLGAVDMNLGDTLTFPANSFQMSFE